MSTQPTPDIRIEEWCDAFVIVVEQDGVAKRFSFNQEDTHEGLVELFHELGFQNVMYEEAY
jgi:hypothetical protein